MADTDDQNHQTGINDLVHDSVVADAHSVHGLPAGERDAVRGTGFIRQQLYCGSNPLFFFAGQSSH